MKLFKSIFAAMLVTMFVGAGPAIAGKADVLKAVATKQSDGVYRFDVTIKSADTGWDYYCDRFEVVDPDGKVIGTRVLYHPHETEQPFTRSLNDVKIPAGVKAVSVRATIKPTGEGGDVVQVKLP